MAAVPGRIPAQADNQSMPRSDRPSGHTELMEQLRRIARDTRAQTSREDQDPPDDRGVGESHSAGEGHSAGEDHGRGAVTRTARSGFGDADEMGSEPPPTEENSHYRQSHTTDDPSATRMPRKRRQGSARQASGDQDGERRPSELEANPYEFARKMALRLLERRDLTTAELTERLSAREVPADVAAAVVTRFVEVGLVNDERYAQRFAESRHITRGLSRRNVAQELRRRGIDQEVIETAVEPIDREAERATALELASRRLQRLAGLPREVQYRRLGGYLARKGYDASLSHAVIQQVLALQAEDDQVGRYPN